MTVTPLPAPEASTRTPSPENAAPAQQRHRTDPMNTDPASSDPAASDPARPSDPAAPTALPDAIRAAIDRPQERTASAHEAPQTAPPAQTGPAAVVETEPAAPQQALAPARRPGTPTVRASDPGLATQAPDSRATNPASALPQHAIARVAPPPPRPMSIRAAPPSEAAAPAPSPAQSPQLAPVNSTPPPTRPEALGPTGRRPSGGMAPALTSPAQAAIPRRYGALVDWRSATLKRSGPVFVEYASDLHAPTLLETSSAPPRRSDARPPAESLPEEVVEETVAETAAEMTAHPPQTNAPAFATAARPGSLDLRPRPRPARTLQTSEIAQDPQTTPRRAVPATKSTLLTSKLPFMAASVDDVLTADARFDIAQFSMADRQRPAPIASLPSDSPWRAESDRTPGWSTVLVRATPPVRVAQRPQPRPAGLRRTRVPALAQAPTPVTPAAPAPARRTTEGALCNDARLSGSRPPAVTATRPGCGIARPVRLTSVIGIRLSQPVLANCALARSFADWIETSARPASRELLGSDLTGLTVAASYSCRTRNNRPGARLSEHATGNAVDISGFRLADGRLVTVLTGWQDTAQGAFLRRLHSGACRLFGTVLGPAADRWHRDHFHFDAAVRRRGYCR
ncbi:MAG: extensin family protein [Pseudomonadota bacterium]